MLGKSPKQETLDLFKTPLLSFIDKTHRIVLLSKEMDWSGLELDLSIYYSETGRPSIPIRSIVGLLILKRMFNESDESVIDRWIENPYWQYFTGELYFQNSQPFDPSDFVHFRKRIGKEGLEKILSHSVKLFGDDVASKLVAIDPTIQEKNITYPTDSKLQMKILKRIWLIGQEYGIKFRRSYRRVSKTWLLDFRFRNHPKKHKKAKASARKLRNACGCLLRELRRKLPDSVLHFLSEELSLYNRVLSQKKKDKNKIYSLHEPEVLCLSKGKAHKPYEFGTKCSVVWDLQYGIVVGSVDGRNQYDGHILESSLEQTIRVTGNAPEEALVDRGCKGKKQIGKTKIIRPDRGQCHANRYQKDKARKKMRKRAGIEPIISHLKYDHRMLRCYLKGVIGDGMNMLLAAIGFNFKKRLKSLSFCLFCTFLGKHLILQKGYLIQNNLIKLR